MKKIYIGYLILFLGVINVNAQQIAENFNVTSKDGYQSNTKSEDDVAYINWEKSYDEALNKAYTENKPLLIYFTGSDWCGPCKILSKKLFNTVKFKKYSDSKFVLYKANFPRNKSLVDSVTKITNKELQVRYGQRKFPTLIIVDGNGNVIDTKRGMYMTEYYYPFFDKALEGYK